MNKKTSFIQKWKGKFILLVIFLGIGLLIMTMWEKKSLTSNYLTAAVERGDIRTFVSATGTLQATITVQVGSQVSGTIATLGATFNSPVKKGQIIATLDPAILQSQVDNAQAAWQSAQAAQEMAQMAYNQELANMEAARANINVLTTLQKDAHSLVERNKQIATVIPTREIESAEANATAADARLQQAQAQYAQAQAASSSAQARITQTIAQVQAAKASLNQQKLLLDKTIITSPVDGVVVSRNIDVGQTVAASLQAPTLFTIANDLTKMQVLASIDEADVGNIKEGQTANFTVDAFPNEVFTGTISQLRVNSVITQNVVTYNAVINFDNPGGKLLPGMTANVTVPVEERMGVLKVPNAALRFKPPTDTLAPKTSPTTMPSSQHSHTSHSSTRQRDRSQSLWTLSAEGKLVPHKVEIGITDGRDTEIISDELKEGDRIVSGLIDANSTRSPSSAGSSSPLGGRAPTSGIPRR